MQKYVMECRASQRTEIGEDRQMGGVETSLRGNFRQAVVWNFDHLTAGEGTAMGIISGTSHKSIFFSSVLTLSSSKVDRLSYSGTIGRTEGPN